MVTEQGVKRVDEGNGVIAELVVIMARVPKSDGHRGGISAFVVEMDSPGITVEKRNAFMGLRGIENGVTRFDNVYVPAENLIGGVEGQGMAQAQEVFGYTRLMVGEWIGPPNVSMLEKPESSVIRTRIWGASSGMRRGSSRH